MLTPSIWDPHHPAYSSNEECMLYWQGNMVEANHRQRILLENVDKSINISDAAYIGLVENNAVENLLNVNLSNSSLDYISNRVPNEDNNVASVITNINPTLDDATIYEKLKA